MPAILILILFVAIDAVFFGFGAATQVVNVTELEQKMEDGDRKAGRILRIVNRPGGFVNSIQILSLLIGVITGSGILMLVRRTAGDPASLTHRLLEACGSRTLAILVMTAFLWFLAAILLVSFGISVPKRLAHRKPEKWAYACIGTVDLFMALLLPIRLPIRFLSHLALRICGIDPSKQEENVTEEDIMSMVNEGHEQGVVEADEAEMITNIFKLNDKHAGDIMNHRRHVRGLDSSMTLKEAVDFLLEEGRNSRYPVYKEDIDNIIGILNMKDAMVAAHNGENESRPISEIPGLLRKAHFIPETRALDTLFEEMQSGKIHMMIVVDEYGQTAGIVTMEDILEEIVGNIVDEYDSEEEMITPLPDGSWLMRGMTPLEDADEAAGIGFDEEEKAEFDTLNGFLIAQLDRIPSESETFTIKAHGFEFRVLYVQNKMARTVKVVRCPEEKPADDAGEADRTDARG